MEDYTQLNLECVFLIPKNLGYVVLITNVASSANSAKQGIEKAVIGDATPIKGILVSADNLYKDLEQLSNELLHHSLFVGEPEDTAKANLYALDNIVQKYEQCKRIAEAQFNWYNLLKTRTSRAF